MQSHSQTHRGLKQILGILMLHLFIYFWFVLESQNLKENSKNNTELFQFQFQGYRYFFSISSTESMTIYHLVQFKYSHL